MFVRMPGPFLLLLLLLIRLTMATTMLTQQQSDNNNNNNNNNNNSNRTILMMKNISIAFNENGKDHQVIERTTARTFDGIPSDARNNEVLPNLRPQRMKTNVDQLTMSETKKNKTRTKTKAKTKHPHPDSGFLETVLSHELRSLKVLLLQCVDAFFSANDSRPATATPQGDDGSSKVAKRSHNDLVDSTRSREVQTGRLFFFKGLKKVMWPIFVGLQIMKSLLFAMFLPSLIGSFGRLVGKGIASASLRPMDLPQDLDFRDYTFNFDEDNNKFIVNDDGAKDPSNYGYNQAEASQMHTYAYNPSNVQQQVLSRYGLNEKQHQKMPDSYLGALQSLSASSLKASGSLSGGSSQSPTANRRRPTAAKLNNFETFQKVPTSSLLLSNYDPFYSPLLSRLDSVFAQLKLTSQTEECREKLVCLMYANPAKYAPYSNLVSAQLSRELNELRKPTSDNAEILRFFKYMRAAKDGQDGIDCEANFKHCDEFKDVENPAMVSTYHDINKLVEARRLT